MSERPLFSPARAGFLFSGSLLLLLLLSTTLSNRPDLFDLILLQSLSFLAPTLLLAVLQDRQPLGALFRLRRLSPAGIGKSLLLGLLAWGLALGLSLLTEALIHLFGGESPQFYTWLKAIPFWQTLFGVALLPAICEEFAFRGYIQYHLQPLGKRASIIVTGLLFAMMHLSLVRIVPLALLGIIFSAAVARVGSLWSGILIHLTNNLISLSLVALFERWPALDFERRLVSGSTLPFLLAVMALISWLIGHLVRSLGPGDLAVPVPPTEEESLAQMRWRPLDLLIPLLPALLLFGWAATHELLTLFTRP